MQAQDVTRRLIFYVPGFDPFPLRHKPSQLYRSTACPSYTAELFVPFGATAQCEQLLELSIRLNHSSNSQRSLAKCSAWSWEVLVK